VSDDDSAESRIRGIAIGGYAPVVSTPLAAGEFQPGFRWSVTDVAVVAVGLCAALERSELGLWIAVAIGHFFLFCNVLRLARALELAWAAVFVLAAVALPLAPALGAIGVASLAVAMIAIRRPSYHGVLWQRINPELPQWWRARR
jgi:hypothetical protein